MFLGNVKQPLISLAIDKTEKSSMNGKGRKSTGKEGLNEVNA